LGFWGSKTNFTLRAFFLFGVSPKVKFYSGPAAHFRGPLWPFGVQGAQNEILHWGRFTF
jgi:hypothetical protein